MKILRKVPSIDSYNEEWCCQYTLRHDNCWIRNFELKGCFIHWDFNYDYCESMDIICKILYDICSGKSHNFCLFINGKRYSGYLAQEVLLLYNNLVENQNCTSTDLMNWLYNHYSISYKKHNPNRRRWRGGKQKTTIKKKSSFGLKHEWIELTDKDYKKYSRTHRVFNISDYFVKLYDDWEYYKNNRCWKRTKMHKQYLKHVDRHIYNVD